MHAHHIEFLEIMNGQVQYVVPRWQRRYRWGQSDIERLIEDLLTVAVAGPDAAHYGSDPTANAATGTRKSSSTID